MNEKRVKKIVKYIKEGRHGRLKEYCRKHSLKSELKKVRLNKDRNLLHLSCQHAGKALFRFLMKNGVHCDQKDSKGNLPLHVALLRAIEGIQGNEDAATVYQDIVLPQIESCPILLESTNQEGISCRELLDRLVDLQNNKRNAFERRHNIWDEDDEDDDKEWRRKLQDEVAYDNDEFHRDTYYMGHFNEETLDEWTERMRTEINAKKKYDHFTSFLSNVGHPKQGSSRNNSENQRNTEKEEKLRQAREEMQKHFEARMKEHQERDKIKRKRKYLDLISKLYTEDTQRMLDYDDIPWPPVETKEDFSKMLFCDVGEDQTDLRKRLLREQQVRWHPDKFVQKLGAKILEKDRERILQKVKEISQMLNHMTEFL